ncbi:type I-E CRISPR-associated protein Cas7/Cse4/CasC [Methylobacter tundripaludum]|uniref:type I-E CRISPR-associated protein Cas7/Cse4/CasC n=1 Tax=Methylobacter tundripaludum TaxID=173365 RepID=UPI0004DF1762|nr:type I-E CRISPR-associated protein Cas7/Cse4/CasC [Methylobacter tundripaludum]
MTQFIQLHALVSYPPSNLNRDDLGRPKTAIMGSANRLRISSQSLKRAWRTSELFESALGEHKGIRTKRIGIEIKNALLDQGVEEKNAFEWAALMAACFGKVKTKKDKEGGEPLEIEQLAHIAPEERRLIDALATKLATEKRAPEEAELTLLRQKPKAVDIALFGRMLASSPAYNVEAAAQVAHAITVHAVKVDDDYFTAVDDLNKHDEDAGAAHIGETGFASGVFYLYVCINKTLLCENLQNDSELVNKTLTAFIESMTKVSPTGKQNSFASRAYTSYLLAEKGPQQPRSLSVAFLKPVHGNDILDEAIKSLNKQYEHFDNVYGVCADDRKFCLVTTEKSEGSLSEIIGFLTAGEPCSNT